jgi:methyl-CpG-binding domain protein 4
MWCPPKSPHGLLQESLWPDEWKILMSCLMLNQTTRKQVDKVVWQFFDKWPDPQSFMKSKHEDVSDLLRPLGFYNRRPKAMRRFTEEYIQKEWLEPIELHGIGKYANDAWRIFCRGDWKAVDPQDHALNKYHSWLWKSNEKN